MSINKKGEGLRLWYLKVLWKYTIAVAFQLHFIPDTMRSDSLIFSYDTFSTLLYNLLNSISDYNNCHSLLHFSPWRIVAVELLHSLTHEIFYNVTYFSVYDVKLNCNRLNFYVWLSAYLTIICVIKCAVMKICF